MKNFKFPQHVRSNHTGDLLAVIGEFPSIENGFDPSSVEDEKGYLYRGKVFQYKSDVKTLQGKFPIIRVVNGEIEILPDIFGDYISEDSLLQNNLEAIEKVTKDDGIVAGEEITAIISSNQVYEPTILQEDDFLKKIIKAIFRRKKTATTKYRAKLGTSYSFSNLFQGLNSDTKITTITWERWIDLLGVDACVIVRDNGGDAETPIGKAIIYRSRQDDLHVVDDSELADYIFGKPNLGYSEDDPNKMI